MAEYNKLIKRLEDNQTLIDVLIQVEDYFDSLDLYAFDNWIEGEIVEGPFVKKYWVSITLKYFKNQKPSIDGAKRLIKHGCKLSIRKGKEEVSIEPSRDNKLSSFAYSSSPPKMKIEDIYLIKIDVPKRFVQTLNIVGIEYEFGVDINDVKTAKDEGITSETPNKVTMEEPLVPEGELT